MSSLAPLRLPHLDPSRTGDASEDLRRVEDWLNTVLPRALQSWGAAAQLGAQEESASAASSDSGGGGGGGSNVEPGTIDGQLLRWDDTAEQWEPAEGVNLDEDGQITVILTVSGTDTPAQITSNQNNYALGSGRFQRLSTDASRTITGFLATVSGDERVCRNVGAFPIVLTNEDVASSAANRTVTGTGLSLTFNADEIWMMHYDGTSQRWVVH